VVYIMLNYHGRFMAASKVLGEETVSGGAGGSSAGQTGTKQSEK